MGALRASALPQFEWRQTGDWEALVDSAPVPDVYYRPGYVRAYTRVEDCEATGVVISAGGSRVLLPLLVRPLRDLAFAQGIHGYDAITAYGYGGILQLDGPPEPDSQSMRVIMDGLLSWCAENDVVSVMLRLHPLMMQEHWFDDSRSSNIVVRYCGQTVALEMQEYDDSAQCITTLAKGRRSDLNYARRNLRVVWALEEGNRDAVLDSFRKRYEQRMEQIGAAGVYRFPREYYEALRTGLGDGLDVGLACADGEAVGGALFLFDRELAHYHLSATNDRGRALKATTLLINAAAGRARQRGCKWLHLGGGTHAEDTLFRFKRSFGGRVCNYSFVNVVADRERYVELVRGRRSATTLPPMRLNFFPEYRA